MQHTDLWTHKIENVGGKTVHVACKNGLEKYREEESESKEITIYREKKLELHYWTGRGFEVGEPIPSFISDIYCRTTLDEIKTMHEVHEKDWEGSSDCSDFNQLIESMDDIFRFPITNIVILAGNSFHGGSEALLEGWCNARAHAQLAVLHTIRKKLKKSETIKCIAQDPTYTDLDKKFLKFHGIEAVDDPAGFAAIDNGSFVYMICGPTWLGTIISKGCRPAALITNEIVDRSSPEWKDERLNMPDGYEEKEFSECSRNFLKVSFYWRNKPVFRPLRPPQIKK